jgi:hypothetical protein
MLKIVGGVGHKIAGFGFFEVSGGKRLNVGKEAIPDPLLGSSGKADQAMPPSVPKHADQQADGNHDRRVLQQLRRIDA